MSIKKTIIENIEEIEAIIQQAQVCYVSMIDLNGDPYVIPMNFGYKDQCFYLHSAPDGKKIDILRKNPKVCITLDIDNELNVRHENVACSYSMKYKSIQAFGKVEFIDEDLEKKRAYMNIIMQQYTQREDFKYNDPAIRNVAIMEIKCDRIIGHNRGY